METATAAAAVLALSLIAPGCGGEAPTQGGPPPAGVEVITLAAAPVERTTEYVAVLKSRGSATLQPMVDGIVTAIDVKSGDRVRAGDPILTIDDSRQAAVVASLRSGKVGAQADLAYARTENQRQQKLYEAGAASEREAVQARTAVELAEAQLAAIDEQLRAEEVQLGYHRVTAPTAGVVGDIPVRVGDRVDSMTRLTTLDTDGGLELYIRVPVGKAAELHAGLTVHVVDDEGSKLADTAIGFVSPQVDQATQTILAKAPMPRSGTFRNEQQVRARVVWSSEPGLTMPIVAVSRVSGRTFAFVVEDGEGGPVARQRTVRLGPVVGNDYVVLDGLAAGERLIVAGTQKVRDGAPVAPREANAAEPASVG